jgi:hypothetical protein
MKESSLSPTARALIDAAKSDGPRAAARAKMWGAVSSATGIAVAGGAVAGTSAVAAASSGKLLAAGALFGSALTVGIAVALVRLVSGGPVLPGARLEAPVVSEARSSAHGREDAREADPAVAAAESDLERSRQEPSPIPLSFSTLGSSHGGPPFAEADRPVPPSRAAASQGRGSAGASGVHGGADDQLSRWGALMMESRGALRRGDPEAALALLEAAHRLGWHQGEPEELKVRVKSLRALGRDSEADDVWARLTTRYPDQAR